MSTRFPGRSRSAQGAGPCLGDVVAALVDGELGHAERERAHRHLAHCARCRAEVDAQRQLKARLKGLCAPPPADPLSGRLLALAGGSDLPLVTRPPGRGALHPAGRPRNATGPARTRPRTSRRPLPRRVLGGAAFLALGLTAALALGGSPSSPSSTVVDPGSGAFVTETVSSTVDAPPARQATLTTGGSGTGR